MGPWNPLRISSFQGIANGQVAASKPMDDRIVAAAGEQLRLPPGLEEYDVSGISLDHFAAHVAEMCSHSTPSVHPSLSSVPGLRLGATPPTCMSAGSSSHAAHPAPRDADSPGATAHLRFFVPKAVGSPHSIPLVQIEADRMPMHQEERIHRLPRQLLAAPPESGGACAYRQIPVRALGGGGGGSCGSISGSGNDRGGGASGVGRDWNSGSCVCDSCACPSGAPPATPSDVRCGSWRPIPAGGDPPRGGHREATFQLYCDDPMYGCGGASTSTPPATTFGVQHSCWMPSITSPQTQLPFSVGSTGSAAAVEHLLPLHFDLEPAAAPAGFPAPIRRRPRREEGERRCATCGTTESPKWRNAGTLCNACGLAARKRALNTQRREAEARSAEAARWGAPAPAESHAAVAQPTCATPLGGPMQPPLPIVIARPIGDSPFLHQEAHDPPTGPPVTVAMPATACEGAQCVCPQTMLPQTSHPTVPLPRVSSPHAAPASQPPLITGWTGGSKACAAARAEDSVGSTAAATGADETRQRRGCEEADGGQHEPEPPRRQPEANDTEGHGDNMCI